MEKMEVFLDAFIGGIGIGFGWALAIVILKSIFHFTLMAHL